MACQLLASGGGNSLTLAQLFNTVYCAYFVHTMTEDRSGTDVFRTAEAALKRCVYRAKAGGRFEASPQDLAVIQKALLLVDAQYVNVSSHIIDDAQVRLALFLSGDSSGEGSPIPPESESDR